MSQVLGHREFYKPFLYDWAYRFYQKQHQMHWLPSEVSLSEDIKDWNFKLTAEERNLLTQIFRFFTQADIDIAQGYHDYYIPKFRHPELRMMLSAFAGMEAIHIEAYSLLLDTIGMPESEYLAFQEYKDMRDKHEYLFRERTQFKHPTEELMYNIATFSAFGEGMQLFSSFAMLMNFPRHNSMKGMGQIITWSIRDESLHVEGMMKLYKTLKHENPTHYTPDVVRAILDSCMEMVRLEDRFIELAFGMGDVKGLTQEEVKQYVRFVANHRLSQLELPALYDVKEHPLPWLVWMTAAVEHTNFFENRATEYVKGGMTGSWEDVWGQAARRPVAAE